MFYTVDHLFYINGIIFTMYTHKSTHTMYTHKSTHTMYTHRRLDTCFASFTPGSDVSIYYQAHSPVGGV
jgi:hypothetical protein